MKNWLTELISIKPLAIFRMLFGLLIVCESFGAILLGWVNKIFVQSPFTFPFVGMEFLEILHGPKMYYYFSIMGICGILISIGYYYRWALGVFTILWTGVYCAQRESYNNHYYFLILACILMLFLPAHKKWSLHTKLKPQSIVEYLPRWMPLILIFQLFILYFYGSVAKLYPDWLSGLFAKNLLSNLTTTPWLQELVASKWVYLTYAYIGIFFDLLVIPFLFYKKTRKWAVIASFIFHVTNAITLKIGIFPFLSLAFLIFFIPENYWKTEDKIKVYQNHSIKLKYFLVVYFIIQVLVPLRHWVIPGDVLFTEEGHKHAWRMMLRERSGILVFYIQKNKNTPKEIYFPNYKLTATQQKVVAHSPDMIWFYCQKIKKNLPKGTAIFVDCKVSINRKPYCILINPNSDMTKVDFSYLKHNEWIYKTPSTILN
jgi:vitamin K-dependent gamma-carboxylase